MEKKETMTASELDYVSENVKKDPNSEVKTENQGNGSANTQVVKTGEQEFSWEALENNDKYYSDEEKNKLTTMYNETLRLISPHEIVEGVVVGITSKEVVLNIGFKSDGLLPLTEFKDITNLKIGDKVSVLIEEQEDKNGQLVLSRKKAKLRLAWEYVNKAFEEGIVLEGLIKSRTKGGLIVDIQGLEAFLPGSQIDIKPIRDYDIYVGKTMEMKVVKINHEFKNVVVSHKILIESELEDQRKLIIANLEKGQVLEGMVKNITDFGAFIDLGGVDGLLHITDISWGRIDHPKEVLALDQKINVVVLEFDDEKKRIQLGLKQLTDHPWSKLDAEITIGSKVKGKIVNIAEYGAFLEVIPGVEGLIHVSEMSWSSYLKSPNEYVKHGDILEAIVLTMDKEERKMSLGIKQLKTNPWETAKEKYAIGSKHKSVVRNITTFGVFVELEEGIEGLIHISDLSWTKKFKHPSEFTGIASKIDVIVLEVDAENKRLALGHKQLEEDPWETFETIFTKDSIHKGTIIKSVNNGAIIALPYGIEAFAHIRDLIKQDGQKAKEDESLEFKVMEFAKENKKIIVSHTKVYEKPVEEKEIKEEKAVDKKRRKAKATNKVIRSINESIEKSTLGDIETLSNLKSELESGVKKKSKETAQNETVLIETQSSGTINKTQDKSDEVVKEQEEDSPPEKKKTVKKKKTE